MSQPGKSKVTTTASVNKPVSRDKEGTRAKVSAEKIERFFKIGLISFVIIVVLVLTIVFIVEYSYGYVGTVGKEKISDTEFRFFLKQQKDNLLSIAGNPQDEAAFWQTNIDGNTAISLAGEKAIDSAQDFEIQLIKAKERKITLLKEEQATLDGRVDQLVDKFVLAGNDESAFKQYYGVDPKEFKAIYRDISVIQKFIEKIDGEMDIKEDDIKKYYEENKKDIDEVTLRHILVAVEKDAAAEKVSEAEKKANDILIRVNNGEDFAVLAKEFSEDQGTKDTGGVYTFKQNGQMVVEFEDWAFSHNAGDTGIVRTDFGFHIMKVDSFRNTYEALKDDTKVLLSQEKYNNMLQEWKNDPTYTVVKNNNVYNTILAESIK